MKRLSKTALTLILSILFLVDLFFLWVFTRISHLIQDHTSITNFHLARVAITSLSASFFLLRFDEFAGLETQKEVLDFVAAVIVTVALFIGPQVVISEMETWWSGVQERASGKVVSGGRVDPVLRIFCPIIVFVLTGLFFLFPDKPMVSMMLNASLISFVYLIRIEFTPPSKTKIFKLAAQFSESLFTKVHS
jgi:hypothetical protein